MPCYKLFLCIRMIRVGNNAIRHGTEGYTLLLIMKSIAFRAFIRDNEEKFIR